MNLFVMMEYKKNCRFGSLCRALHSAKDPVAKCHGHSTRQSWKNRRSENHFSSFAECHDHGTRQIIFFKKNSNFAECRPEGTRQRIFFLKKIKLCRVPARRHSAKNFKQKIQTLSSAGKGALGKYF